MYLSTALEAEDVMVNGSSHSGSKISFLSSRSD